MILCFLTNKRICKSEVTGIFYEHDMHEYSFLSDLLTTQLCDRNKRIKLLGRTNIKG